MTDSKTKRTRTRKKAKPAATPKVGGGPTAKSMPWDKEARPRRAKADVTAATVGEAAVFASAGPRVKGKMPLPPLPTGVQAVGDSRFYEVDDDQLEKELDRLSKALAVGSALEAGSIRSCLNHAETNALDAHALHWSVRKARVRYEQRALKVEAAMREHAKEELVEERTELQKEGKKSKMITDADVEAKIASMFPQQAADLAERRLVFKAVLAYSEKLADLWHSRCASLRQLAEGGIR